VRRAQIRQEVPIEGNLDTKHAIVCSCGEETVTFRTQLKAILFVMFLTFTPVLYSGVNALAHNAPSGMPYPTDCCSDLGLECEPIPEHAITLAPLGYVLRVMPGEHKNVRTRPASTRLFVFGSDRIKVSTDGQYHACIDKEVAGRPAWPWCIIIPQRGDKVTSISSKNLK
jgi:hypothetical protein